jgi:hypothetical protein
MARTTPGRRPIVWISVAAASVAVIAVVLVVSIGGSGTSIHSSQPITSTNSTATSSTATCAGSSTSQTVTAISGPVLVGDTGKVAAGVTCADGHLGTILYYNYGQPISVAVTVPDSLVPTAIQTVFDGNPQNSNQWNVNSTGHTYVLGYGAAGESPLTVAGLHDVYAIVTFSDKSKATSNLVYFTVYVPPALR